MMVKIIDGKVIVVEFCVCVVDEVVCVKCEYNLVLGFVVVLVGNDFVSEVYVCFKYI